MVLPRCLSSAYVYALRAVRTALCRFPERSPVLTSQTVPPGRQRQRDWKTGGLKKLPALPGLSPYQPPMRSPVLRTPYATSSTSLRAPYAISGADLAAHILSQPSR
eukprot:1545664-Rhodomonas_salina.5